ncbi:hypothetical protein [Variovorax sp. E3]|uniref:hypothetical protein n=1 Tax=Variovorax sp. E3 TaxID=1914993 RepID=UPI0022B6B0FC|nr:hypothetical protein [Variovorax sp. E3]
MRTLLLALMIALLPIRGWLGDAMAVEMVRHSMPATSSVSMATAAATEAHCHEAMEAGGGMDMAMSMMADHAGSHDDTSSSSHSGTDHQAAAPAPPARSATPWRSAACPSSTSCTARPRRRPRHTRAASPARSPPRA